MDIQQGTLPFLEIAGRRFTDVNGLIVLSGWCQTTKWSSFKTQAGVSYVVPAAKTFRLLAISFWNEVASGGLYIGYSDNDAGVNSSTVLTNAVYAGGTDDNSHLPSLAAYTQVTFPQKFDIPTGKYPLVKAAAVTLAVYRCRMWGYEV